jgi:hypothetical protein
MKIGKLVMYKEKAKVIEILERLHLWKEDD